MKKILITGGAGFVGRHFVDHFLKAGDEVHCVDPIVDFTGGIDPSNWPFSNPMQDKNFHFHKMDCREYFKKFQDNDFDYSLHLAAMVGGRLMIENNPLAVADDLSIDAEYWQWAARTRPKKTICFSSSAAYPVEFQKRQDYKLLTEDMIKFDGATIGQPDMSYGWAKLTHEYLAKLAYEKNGLCSVVYRPFSGYGEDQDMTYPFPSICARVLKNINAKEITVWGTGDQMRDFIHIDDCVRGVISTMDKINDASAINLSTGIYTSFKGLASLAAELEGFNPVIVGTSDKPEGVFARGGDTQKQEALGFKYVISLKDGVSAALKWLKLNPKGIVK
ncbi:MAG: NAD-dependent epimerase/dehydratase family protein [Verrucomicrobiota bacterium]|nr:NAD-dependent epimerase/dehydratase family protein [Verrucomicrobiota bacterium]